MKILLLGKDGQVGWELQRALAPLGEVIACNRQEADLEQPETLRQLVRNIAPQIVVNAAAYTAVDRAESEPGRAMCINGEAVGVLAEEIKSLSGWLIHYSTDYVFGGDKSGIYLEQDIAEPINVYGKSKLMGEKAIVASGCKYLIFRSGWVFSVRGKNFMNTILRLAEERLELKVIDDQVGAPTGADLIADVTALALYRIKTRSFLDDELCGIYHLVAMGEVSWFEYARYIVETARKKGAVLKTVADQVHPISTSDYPLPAARPLNSRMSTTKLCSVFNIFMPGWRVGVDRALDEIFKKVVL